MTPDSPVTPNKPFGKPRHRGSKDDMNTFLDLYGTEDGAESFVPDKNVRFSKQPETHLFLERYSADDDTGSLMVMEDDDDEKNDQVYAYAETMRNPNLNRFNILDTVNHH